MLKKTHVAAGIASALIITHPDTISGIIAATAGGALGGWIVDVDCKKVDIDHETIYDTIIEALFIGALFFLDYLIGNGICHYVLSHGLEVWIALMAFVFLTLFGFGTTHRTFTHSFLALGLFSTAVFFACRPLTLPFAIGYASHLILDLLNKGGMQLFYPIKKRFCLNILDSDKKANNILMIVFFVVDVIAIAGLVILSISRTGGQSETILKLQTVRLFGLNSLQLYLIFINVLTYLECQRNWNMQGVFESGEEEDDEFEIKLDFHTWILNFYLFIGGGFGMLLFMVLHLQYPAGYNGNWWSFCYASVMIWSVIYSYICNPFGFTVGAIDWDILKHTKLLIYWGVINIISALLFYIFKDKYIDELSVIHTILLLVGFAGGTLGGIPVVLATRHLKKFHYALLGFPIMLAAQIIFIIYMMAAGVL